MMGLPKREAIEHAWKQGSKREVELLRANEFLVESFGCICMEYLEEQLKVDHSKSLKKMRETIDMFKKMAERSSRNNVENLMTNQKEIEGLKKELAMFKRLNDNDKWKIGERTMEAKYSFDKKKDIITKDGHTMFKEDIVTDLNRKSFLEKEMKRLQRGLR